MKAYRSLLEQTQDEGSRKLDRTLTGTTTVHNIHFSHDLSEGFPAVTTKKLAFRSVQAEWVWMMLGMTDVRWLQDNKCTIWDEWATVTQCNKFNRVVGDLGPVYGHQWRNFGATRKPTDDTLWYLWSQRLLEAPVDINFDEIVNIYEMRDAAIEDLRNTAINDWGYAPSDIELKDLGKYYSGYLKNGYDQVAWLLKELKFNPASRRLIVSGWNPKEANEVALPPCHTLWQLQTTEHRNENGVPTGQNVLNLTLHQRSWDLFLGAPFNIAFYALTIHFFARYANMVPGSLGINGVDAHIYDNHHDAVAEQLSRTEYALPELEMSESLIKACEALNESITQESTLHEIGQSFNELLSNILIGEDFKLKGYQHHPAIKADVAV